MALILLGALALIVVQLLDDEGKPDGTTLGLFVAAGVLCFAVFAPGMALDAVRRITRLKVGGVEVSLDEIKRAADLAPPEQLDGVEGKPRPENAGYDECVEELQSRLSLIRSMLDLGAPSDDYIAIAEELRGGGLLSRTEEEFVIDLQGGDPISGDWSTKTEKSFLDDTWKYVVRLRSTVWDRYVRQQLKSRGCFIVDYAQKPGHRADFLAYKDERWILVAARVSPTKKNPDRLELATKRLIKFEKEFENGPPIGAKFIIAPDSKASIRSAGYLAGLDDAVAVVTLDEFGLDAATGGT